MAAEKTAEEKKSRRRRRTAEGEPVDVVPTEGKGRATPGRRTQDKKTEGNFITRPLRGIADYLSEVRNELDKVTWPNREDTIRLTRIVLLTTVASALVLGGLSLLAGQYVRIGLDQSVIFVVTFIAIVAAAIVMMRRAG